MDPMPEEIKTDENPLDKAIQYIMHVLEMNEYHPKDDTSIYCKDKGDVGFMFVPLNSDGVREACDSCFIDTPKDKKTAIYVTTFIDNPDLLWEIKNLKGKKSENKLTEGIMLDNRYIKIRCREPTIYKNADQIVSFNDEYLTLPMYTDDEDRGILLGLGVVDQNGKLQPGHSFKEATDLAALLEYPDITSMINQINSTQIQYRKSLEVMRNIAFNRGDVFSDGSEDMLMRGTITSPLPDGRQIIIKLSTITCNEKGGNVPEIDGSLYLQTKVATPYSAASIGLTALDEIPAYFRKTTKETIYSDVNELMEQLKTDFRRNIAYPSPIPVLYG
ncbi:MAG: hypothetical protein ABIG84_07085 [archaeon]